MCLVLTAVCASAAPDALNNLHVWYDASYGVYTDGNNNVTNWQDRSGNGYHLNKSNSSGVNPPAYLGSDAALNSQPAIDFDDKNKEVLQVGYGSSKTLVNASVFVVFVPADNNTVTHMLVAHRDSGTPLIQANYQNGSVLIQARDGGALVSSSIYGGATNAGKIAFYEVPENGLSDAVLVSTNGSAEVKSATSSFTDGIPSTLLMVGAYNDGSIIGGFFNGRIAEIVFYSDLLTPAEKNEIGYYLADKYGIATSYKAPVGTGPQVNVNLGAVGITTHAAWLRGTLTATGDAPATVWSAWGTSDGGINALTAWAPNTNSFGIQPEGSYSNRPALAPDTHYVYRFYAQNTKGSNWSALAAFDTAIAAAPTVESASALSTPEIGVEWSGTFNTETAFVLNYTNASGNETITAAANSTFQTISWLQFSTEYAIRVAASNAVGLGPWSAWTNVTTVARKTGKGLSVVDFGDVAIGALNGQSGGTGFAGTWGDAGSESTTLQVEAGDRTSLRCYLPAAGDTTRSVGAPDDNSAPVGHISRSFDVAKTGTVWFTYIAYRENASREGISFNETGASSDLGNRILFVEDKLHVTLGGTVVANIPGKVSAGVSYLVLGQVIVNPSGNDTLRVWFNPTLTDITSPAGLPATDVNDTSADFAGSAWERVGMIACDSGGKTGSGGLDHLRISNTDTSFEDVTGVLSVSGFDPRSIASLRFWIRADVGVYTAGSLAATNGQAVRSMADYSTTLMRPGQLTSGARPTLAPAAVNGLPAIRFNGSSQFLTFGTSPIVDLDGGEELTVLAVARPNIAHNLSLLGLRGGEFPPIVQLDQDDTGKPRFIAKDGAGNTAASVGREAVTLGAFAVYGGMLSGPKSSMTARVTYNGVAGIAATANFHANLNVSEKRIGGLNAGPFWFYWDGDIAEILIFADALDATELRNVGCYLSEKYGIATTYTPQGTVFSFR